MKNFVDNSARHLIREEMYHDDRIMNYRISAIRKLVLFFRDLI